jgi:hypothetical protein
MRRISTMMASAGAAALTTLAVTVAVPAIGDEGGGGGSPAPGPAALAACLAAHGLPGAPTDDALKEWLRQRLDAGDATAQQALEACAPEPVLKADRAADEAQLRACLKDHGAAVPDATGGDLKRWIIEHHTEAATATALEACHLEVGDHDGAGSAGCAKGDGVGGRPADKPDASTGKAAKITRHQRPAGI